MESLLLPILMFGALGLMMYFGMRKQKRQVAEMQAMQESLVPGTRVMTTSGLQGVVVSLADDTIDLEVAPGVTTTWVRAAVREVVVPNDAAALDSLTDSADDAISDRAGEVNLDKRQPGSDIS